MAESAVSDAVRGAWGVLLAFAPFLLLIVGLKVGLGLVGGMGRRIWRK